MLPAQSALSRSQATALAIPAQAIRSLHEDDIAAVAALFQQTFRKPARPAPPSLVAYLRDLFLNHPHQDPRIGSLVFTSDNAVVGFIGLLPTPMIWRGETITAAVAAALMVDNPKRHPTAGARLVRSALRGPQDVTLSESASPQSRRMWALVGAEAIPAYSLDWLRILRPISFPLELARHRFGAPKVLAHAGRPFDGLLDRLGRNPFAPPQASRRTQGRDADDDAVIRALPALVAHHPLRPQLRDDVLPWMLRHAARKEHYGSLVRRLVVTPNGEVAGAYFYYARPNGLGFVLQTLARPGFADDVIQDMLVHACASGLVGLKGRAQPDFADGLMRNKCVFWNGGSTVAHSTRPEVMRDIANGQALVTGFAAEAWTRLIGGEFT